MWTWHVERALKLAKQRQTLGFRIRSQNLNSHSAASIPVGALLACCQGIVVVDKVASTVPLGRFAFTTTSKLPPGSLVQLARRLRKHA